MLKSNQLKIYLLTLLSFFVGTSQFIIADVLDKIANSLNIKLKKQLLLHFSCIFFLIKRISSLKLSYSYTFNSSNVIGLEK